MKFTYRKKNYELGFKHGQETNQIPGYGEKEQRFTIATIVERMADGSVAVEGTGKVRRYFRDIDNHEIARKEALRVALSGMKNRNFRRAVWAVYNTRPGGILFGKPEREVVVKSTQTATATV